MYHNRGKGGNRRGRGSKGPPTTKAPLKGLFSDGVWKCNCDPRLPAQHFQTKNGGKNHGRWFYTCQHPQPKRCDFFLWEDEAKGREAAAVLNNSRTEPGLPAPATPSMPVANTGLVTPQTGGRYTGWGAEEVQTPYTKDSVNVGQATATRGKNDTQATITTADDSDEEFYDWPASSDAEEFGKAADEILGNQSSSTLNEMRALPQTSTETPRKSMKTDMYTTPGKRRYDEMDAPAQNGHPTPTTGSHGDDVFVTPNLKPHGRLLFAANNNNNNKATAVAVDTPPETPTPIRYKDIPPLTSNNPSELASEILATLTAHAVTLPPEARDAVIGVCNRHVLYTRGITKGRDVSRAMVKTKSERVVEMQGEIEELRAERETDRAVIRHLRREMAVRKEGRGR